MFLIDEKREVKEWPVTIAVPADQGKTTPMKITLDFILADHDELEPLKLAGDKAFIDFMCERITGWGGIGDASGELALEPEALQAFLKHSFVRRAVVQSYISCNLGQAAAKN